MNRSVVATAVADAGMMVALVVVGAGCRSMFRGDLR